MTMRRTSWVGIVQCESLAPSSIDKLVALGNYFEYAIEDQNYIKITVSLERSFSILKSNEVRGQPDLMCSNLGH